MVDPITSSLLERSLLHSGGSAGRNRHQLFSDWVWNCLEHQGVLRAVGRDPHEFLHQLFGTSDHLEGDPDSGSPGEGTPYLLRQHYFNRHT